MNYYPDQNVSITGTIHPCEFDDSGNVTAIAVVMRDQKRLVLSKRGVGAELFEHIGRPVQVKGITEEDQYGDLVLTVNEYSIVASTGKHSM